jgi:hypothetical protein
VSAPTRSLAYPYGETREQLKMALPPRFFSARGVLPGINHGRTDLAQLRAYPLFGDSAMARAFAALKQAAKRKGWIVCFTHDVSAAPSPWGTSADDLDRILRTAHQLGVTVLPVTQALERRLT